ncbi:MAG: hypothetical protein P1V51_13915 [Deltaproteobacteria bacterium]|nr:hypothetical protein [Deltaproteobacteria bacterium]
MNRLLVPFLSATLILAAGCPDKGGQTPTDGGSDGGTQDSGPPPPPARELVEYKLFGEMPLDNGVLDPQLTAQGYGWFSFTGQGDYADVVRRVHSNTPTGQPVLQLPKNGVGAGQVFLAGMARGGQGPRVASIWVGRPAGQVDFTNIDVTLLAFDAQAGGDRAFDLAENTDAGSMFEQDGVMWQNRIATIDTDLFGWTMLTVTDAFDAPLYVTGPVVAGAATRTGLYRPRAPAKVRAELKPGELEAVRLARLALKERLQGDSMEAAREKMMERAKRAMQAVQQAKAAKGLEAAGQ